MTFLETVGVVATLVLCLDPAGMVAVCFLAWKGAFVLLLVAGGGVGADGGTSGFVSSDTFFFFLGPVTPASSCSFPYTRDMFRFLGFSFHRTLFTCSLVCLLRRHLSPSRNSLSFTRFSLGFLFSRTMGRDLDLFLAPGKGGLSSRHGEGGLSLGPEAQAKRRGVLSLFVKIVSISLISFVYRAHEGMKKDGLV
jgi:hypothetical protein